jgi:branched-chain amino acid transport system permease protein
MNNKYIKSIIIGICFVAAICVPLLANDYYQYTINIILVNLLVSLGFAILLGYSGQLAFASAGFMGLGAYTVGLSMVHLGLPFLLAIILAIIVSLLFAIFLGFIGLRLSKYYLAIATLAFTFAMCFFYINVGKITFGPSGFNIPKAYFLGMILDTDAKVYYVVLLFVVALFILIRNFIKSKIGRAFIAIREDEAAALSASINVNYYKMLAFILAGILGGTAGGLYCIVLGRITPTEFGMGAILLHFFIVVLGGLGSLAGLVISCIILMVLPEVLRIVVEFQEILYGGFIILLILFGPEGIYGLLKKLSRGKLREKLYGN